MSLLEQTVLEQVPKGSRVAIIRLRSLGDCVLTTPAISLLHRARPDLEVGISVEARFADVFAGNQRVSRVLEPSWLAVRSWKPRLCVNLHGGTRSQWMTALSGARWRAGFAHHSTTLAYNFKIPRAQQVMGVTRRVHTAEHLASAFFALGVPLSAVPRAELFAGESSVPSIKERHAVLHPFASSVEKSWPAARFNEVARYLKLCNVKPVFLAGLGDDATAFREHTVLQSGLAEVKAALADAVLFVGNDSGPAHMAAAFGVPSVVLFSTSDPAIWEPWQTESEVIVARDGIESVTVSRVITAIERLRTLAEAHA
ncbi:MAG TPA: glycosyltransferase family 9 protein [Bryobacteraceae bacterium]|jgi:ADP-heptose:LPS heptosyltransferase|nr:glycosyltransferase family 9 protein [Bryobacteraceae bacterium]